MPARRKKISTTAAASATSAAASAAIAPSVKSEPEYEAPIAAPPSTPSAKALNPDAVPAVFSTPQASKRSNSRASAAIPMDQQPKSVSKTVKGANKRVVKALDLSPSPQVSVSTVSVPSTATSATTTETPATAETDVSSSSGGRIAVDGRVEEAYRILRLTTGQLGGNGYAGAIYGELTMRSMQRVLNIMTEKCGLKSDSRFIDVGAGLGKPNFHAAQDPAVRLSIGVELETIRWQLSMHNMQTFLAALMKQSSSSKECSDENTENCSGNTPSSRKQQQRSTVKKSAAAIAAAGDMYGGVNFVLSDIDEANSLDPFTHIYQFDLGFPPPLQKRIAEKFNRSLYAQCLVSYRPPRRVIEEYGFAVDFVDQVLCSMHGSGEGHTAYFYLRNNKPPLKPSVPKQRLLTIPPRTASHDSSGSSSGSSSSSGTEVEQKVYCDEVFFAAAQLAVGPAAALSTYVDGVMEQYVDAGRPQRVRKQRVITDASNL